MEFPAAKAPRGRPWLLGLLVLLVVAALAAVPYVLLAPSRLGYSVRDGVLHIDARLGLLDHSRDVPLADIRDAAPVTSSGGIRVAGTGRPPDFCAGRWNTPETGSAWAAFPCAADDLVMVDLGDERLLLGPADREGFVAALRDGAGEFPPVPVPGPGLGALVWLVPLLIFPLALTAWVLWRLRRPFVYIVADGVLVVPTHFRPLRLPLTGAKAHAHTLGRWTWRVAGTAFPGRYLGLFAAGRKTLHVAATSYDGVLVEGTRTVFVTPADRAGFLAALHDAGAVTE